MTNVELIKEIEKILTVFGGISFVCVGLITFLGQFLQKRTLQKEQHKLSESLKKFENELELKKSSYEHYLELIMNYYETYYDHYRLCQYACETDAIRNPDGSITNTKNEFDSKLDSFLNKWAEQEGKIRLLLPAEILEIHDESIQVFNKVRDSVRNYRNCEETRAIKLSAFKSLHNVKGKMEKSLRAFLRTESLLK